MHRSSFTDYLNKILEKASRNFTKNIRTHSFRATIITTLLEPTPINGVKQFIGHRKIKSTLTYKTTSLTGAQIKEININLDKAVKYKKNYYKNN